MERNTFGKLCRKLLIRLIGLDICCFITSAFCITSSGSHIIRTLIQICCIIALISFLYPVCHTQGDIDRPLVSAGHRRHSNLKGLYAGIIACSPFIISAIVLLFSKFTGLIPNFVNYYKMINAVFFPFLYSILPVDYSLAELSYHSIFAGVSVQTVIPILCMFSYLLGFNRFSYAEKVFYKNKEDKEIQA